MSDAREPTTVATRPSQPGERGDLLRTVLAAEHAAVYGYGIVGAHLTDGERAFAGEAWNAHRANRDRLRLLLAGGGPSPAPAAPAYRLPFEVDGPQTAARLAARLEEGAIEAYVGLVAVSEPTLRRFASLAMQDCAGRATRWRRAAAAFPGLPAHAVSRTPEPDGTARS